ncbi:hypothetical protein PISMIDRAFT_475065 [Pisolithus microcarpus 441]|uniref:Uncharacterized protein n=1 Tax=Pisolithus microcarpus 441 TaxID=765257 RepID=A0A0C9YDB8_9AGAM|nr:hypothetical protein BKA83DRAFT_475065 [Pisolithus microcarpus]KIK11794.1 hypothetical protein PISMIDRAFT_475065 [Pisolithus microcarpus 441]
MSPSRHASPVPTLAQHTRFSSRVLVARHSPGVLMALQFVVRLFVSSYAQKLCMRWVYHPVSRNTRHARTTSVADTFIRIGSFEALSPSRAMFFFGGGQQYADYEALRILGERSVKRVLKLDIVNLDGCDA